ncbi:response regulator [Clostridium oryzae]|uniref:Stage 0 sporulation protein A homolog n=1 Tax=Clostridium oryzae TaxID=1450648 RepID=A0A1V4IAR4_9CLOT|nr:response regulator [Clostridium oryzae]OPJ56607.1 putative response regulatory protein [Clostridium oryzae]
MSEKNDELFKVLIVDDEPFVRQGLRELIDWKKYGYKIDGEANDGEEALEIIKRASPDIVVTDIRMPEMDGLEFIREAREFVKKDTEFIILSGYGQFEYAQKAIEYGVSNYLLKPIEEEQLIEILLSSKEKFTKNRNKLKYHESKNIIKKLISNNLDEDTKLKIRSMFNKQINYKQRFVVIESDIVEWMEQLEGKKLESKIDELKETILKQLQGNIINLYEEYVGRYGVIVNEYVSKQYEGNICEFADELHRSICSNAGCSNCIVIGKEVDSLWNIFDSYKSCESIKSYKYINNSMDIINYDSLNEIEYNYYYDFSSIVDRIYDAIERGNKEQIISVVDEFFENMLNYNIAPEIIKTHVMALLFRILSNESEKHGDMAETVKTIKNLNISEGNISVMKSTLIKFLNELTSYVNSLQSNNGISAIYEVESYIKRNFEKDLTLKNLAKEFFINPVYLGQLLKKKLGMYFNDYLHYIRVEEAKKLLRRSNLKLYEIANRVGYSDTNYFINKFEKITSLTPVQYKKSVNKSKE